MNYNAQPSPYKGLQEVSRDLQQANINNILLLLLIWDPYLVIKIIR
jgi:hypothetical protein